MFLLVILAMIAGFMALQLYRVLGKRTGHEQPLPKPAEERTPLTLVPRPVEAIADAREPASRLVEPKAEAGIRSIIAADSSFEVARFLQGAQAAYRMILEAFWQGDQEQLDWLTERSVRDAFVAAIAERDDAGHSLENRLVSIERAVIADAVLEGKVARITVRFDADIAAITRDADSVVIAGSMTDAVETHDVWTFMRTLKSNDPNWKLADTDEV
ncbi:Tim44/TimA family putative adaptor protein [Sphingomonas sp. PAMC 26621]|uniref:Tim44/TimA family putative adaptor protein n=1 Tax=Sphingomonas sp. PAMC 26621 TaxID=1112213 RepID=UPI000474A36A|nr:Tim44/TimA family putative adaptor protein [Sphingomonas sp. PAMC 26621]